MWLLNTEKIELKWFETPNEVSYAILSHVWGEDEQTFEDTPCIGSKSSRGVLRRASDRAFRRPSLKIRSACARARRDGFRWLWVDTCCIDKSNSAQLSEAINSMYVYYRSAAMCYALLHDVPSGEDCSAPKSAFRKSNWFKRGWTLQELIAPHSVIFLSKDWEVIGAKWRLASLLEKVTGIDRRVLTHKRTLEDVSVACRMSWAAGRKTTRSEDEAYSLMGIFGVYMPTIYGEGRHAFVRLQEEIIKKSPDQSIFAWGRILEDYSSGTFVESAREHDYEPQSRAETLLASSPADFANCADISPIPLEQFADRLNIRGTVPEYTTTSFGLRTTFPMVSVAHTSFVDAALALLACEDSKGRLIALYLRSHPRLSTSSKYYVGGYIAQGGRRNFYHRGTRLSIGSASGSTAHYRQPSRNQARMSVLPTSREVHVHSHPPESMARLRVPRSISTTPSSPSDAHSSMIFFEPPCTIILSERSRARLRGMGFMEPKIPQGGFRLQDPGDYRSISFVGYESFTVHFGVCPLDMSSSTQLAQLWACARFDAELDSVLLEDSNAARKDGLPAIGVEPPQDVVPDESMLVQSWRNARTTFGSKEKQVRLSFSYPCAGTLAESKVAEVYELDIRFEGHCRINGVSRVATAASTDTTSGRSGWI